MIGLFLPYAYFGNIAQAYCHAWLKASGGGYAFW